MATIEPAEAEEFAVAVVRRLREAGYESLWAGGCVRDRLLGKPPKDYDVATNATPDQIRQVFGRRRTLAIGAAFGVITVLGPKRAGQIEVATFRRDSAYSDGRHPDSVAFSTAQEDASRRDFTVNGLFFDPITGEVIDYVGGRADLAAGVLRAIGNPHERFAEDKLRMLRAVRFATTLGFHLDPATMAAVQQHASEIIIVSAERTAEELRRTLIHAHRQRGAELLRESTLLEVIFPELQMTSQRWQQTAAILGSMKQPTSSVALAGLLRGLDPSLVEPLSQRLRLSNEERDGIWFCWRNEDVIQAATTTAWSIVQRTLIERRAVELLDYCEAVAIALQYSLAAIEFCRAKLALPPDELDPPALVTGDDLRRAGIPPGRAYGHLLTAVRDAQLEGTIRTREQGLELAHNLFGSLDD